MANEEVAIIGGSTIITFPFMYDPLSLQSFSETVHKLIKHNKISLVISPGFFYNLKAYLTYVQYFLEITFCSTSTDFIHIVYWSILWSKFSCFT